MADRNKFCERDVLRNESDVEHFFVDRLLDDIGFKDKNILNKAEIPKHLIGKGAKKKTHRPDYALKIGHLWKSVIEVKHPKENLLSCNQESQDYATIHNRGYIDHNPIEYVLTTNGIKTYLLLVNQNKPVIELDFKDFVDGNHKYSELQELYSYTSLLATVKPEKETFEFRKPEVDELTGIFQQCHQIIWKKHKVPPKVAFYEFTKLLFIKLNEDKKIHNKIKKGKKITPEDFFFSIREFEKQQKHYDNPINHKFIEYRNSLNREVQNKTKKRIFEDDEKLKLTPSTMKEIIRLLQNLDLKSVEDDLNGKVFETFLEATVRGKALGQFFTPRDVVKFMIGLTNLQMQYNQTEEKYMPPKILDGCCGSGGFLIFSLSELIGKAEKLPTDYKKLKDNIKNNYLYGIDASEDKIVQICRMNMYVHGDGGSHIYNADTLDKELYIEKGLDEELAEERTELKKLLERTNFDVVLTNPPFSMRYSVNDQDNLRILKQYDIAYPDGKNVSNRVKSLKSNVMFVERYYDLLKFGGKLITIIDESVLNADGQGNEYRKFRKWLRQHFIIKAIISLPKNTFVNADAGVKTSIIYLIKKKNEKQEQPIVFMGMSKNVGHNDSGRSTPEKNDLPELLESFRKFERGNDA